MLLRGALGLFWKDILFQTEHLFTYNILFQVSPMPPSLGGLSKPCLGASRADRMRRSGEQAVNQKKRNSRSETDSTRVEGSVARHSRGLSVHRFWLVWRMVSICVPCRLFRSGLEHAGHRLTFKKENFLKMVSGSVHYSNSQSTWCALQLCCELHQGLLLLCWQALTWMEKPLGDWRLAKGWMNRWHFSEERRKNNSFRNLQCLFTMSCYH